MLTLSQLACSRPPALNGLELAIEPGELPVIVGADAAERAALVELLAGYRAETGGEVALDGDVLVARQRRSSVVILPHQAALTPDLSVGEHVKLVARLRGARVDGKALASILAFAKVDNSRHRPEALTLESRLRLTLALALVGKPALAVALDPPPNVAALLPELRDAAHALLIVAPSLNGLEHVATRVHGLSEGVLSDGLGAPAQESGTRAYVLRVAAGSKALEAFFATQGGVNLDRVQESRDGRGMYRLRVTHDVAVAPMIRALVRAGVLLEMVTPVAEARLVAR